MDQLVGVNGVDRVGAILVLADFGGGKTTLLQNVEYHRAKAHYEGEDARLPLFVSLRDFRESQDVGVLLQTSFRETFYRDLPLGVLWQRIESGSFYLLLDGFDEMVDRSDSARRLELFHALVPLLRSRSPVLLTTRPSYLVERGELESLLASVRSQEESGPAPVSGGTHAKVVAEQLRQQLFEQMQEDNRPRRSKPLLDANQVRVVRLGSLDSSQVEQFVARHADDLAEVEASVTDLQKFIERTYDLSDLATRPMLLRLIVNTVVIGGLDLSDTTAEYGPSNLYEIYTHAKLDYDVEKIRGKQTGLNVDTRRRLAESLALEMYCEKSLESDFRDHLKTVATENRELRDALNESGLSEEEIATDLAARSFVTLDEDGVCRFIHKSFRGFFVARLLKAQLPKLDKMFDDFIEDEVLYFLGGFAPTEPHVGKALWNGYRDAEGESTIRRRNLLVAFLHTKPVHNCHAANTEIGEAEFGRLQFAGSRFSDIVWRDVTVMGLELFGASWRNVQLRGSRFTRTLIEGGDFKIAMSGSSLEAWNCIRTNGVIDGSDSTIDHWNIEHSMVRCTPRDGFAVKEAHLDSAQLILEDKVNEADEGAVVGEVTMKRSRIVIPDVPSPSSIAATDSVLVCDTGSPLSSDWTARRSVLSVEGGPPRKRNREADERVPPTLDRSSVILSRDGVPVPLLKTRAGIFGTLWPSEGEFGALKESSAWGVLEANDLLNFLDTPRKKLGWKLGRLILLRTSKYRALEQKELSSAWQLGKLVSDPAFDVSGDESIRRVEILRKGVRTQYEELWQPGWPDLGPYIDA